MPTELHPIDPDAAPALRSILVVDADAELRRALTVLLKQKGYAPTSVASAEAGIAQLERRGFDAVFADGAELTPSLAGAAQGATLLLLTDDPVAEATLAILTRGAYERVHKPIVTADLDAVLRNVEERVSLSRDNAQLRREREARRPRALDDATMIGDSAAMQGVQHMIRKIAEHKTTVLITGESGTGKELVARAIHAASPRRDAPFIAVNCGAIPEALLESELFGHKQGAFTDAVRDKRGLFSEASTGTLFLDEIGELPLGPQVKLLRVLQEQQVRPVGSTEDEQVDVRVVAATMRDLAADVRDGRFREDLFYRLNVIQLALPSLRERREDLPRLIEHFLARTNDKLGTHVREVAPDALRLLSAYDWPGNVRELENTIERSVVLCEGDSLTIDGLPERLRQRREPLREALLSGELSIKKTVRIIEEELIRRALAACAGNRTNTAKKLEISHRALLYKMKEFGIVDPPSRAFRGERVEKFDGEG